MNFKIEQTFNTINRNNSRVLSNILDNTIYNKINYFPILSAVVKETGTKTSKSENEDFIIDTGASITILNYNYKNFFKNEPVANFNVQYGTGNPKPLNVYRATLFINGYEVEILAAVDETLKLNSLLGNNYGLENIGIFVSNYIKKFSKLIKK